MLALCQRPPRAVGTTRRKGTAMPSLVKVGPKQLAEQGYDAHKIKQEYAPSDISQFDLFYDKNTRKIYVARKDGSNAMETNYRVR